MRRVWVHQSGASVPGGLNAGVDVPRRGLELVTLQPRGGTRGESVDVRVWRTRPRGGGRKAGVAGKACRAADHGAASANTSRTTKLLDSRGETSRSPLASRIVMGKWRIRPGVSVLGLHSESVRKNLDWGAGSDQWGGIGGSLLGSSSGVCRAVPGQWAMVPLTPVDIPVRP